MSLISLLFFFLLAAPFGIQQQPVTSSHNIEILQGDTIRISFNLTISQGWHVYSTNMPKGGPTSANLEFDSIRGIRPVGALSFTGQEIDREDPVFQMRVRYFENKVSFHQDFLPTEPNWFLEGSFVYGTCNDVNCLPPQRIEFCHSSEPQDNASTVSVTDMDAIDGYDARQWAPVDYDKGIIATQDNSLWGLFLTSLLGGLIALLTPCVWPVIPMTVSFFLKRSSSRRKAVTDAVAYGLSIISVYVALGLAITLIFGANALNALATNAIVNIVFFLILVVFALSFFGLFEITLPSGWSTGTDRKAGSNGMGGIFFMALTLTIVSFSCTGPIIGFLLVDAASTGSILAPVVGMSGFSVGMAIPFTLFAMFPGWLKSMPKSGGWMDRVKVTLGFVELAFSLKFLSVADMAYGWGILPRDLFVLLWIIMAVALGLYLMDIKSLLRKGQKRHSGIVGTLVGILSLFFAAWLVPGLWGAPLKAISAFTPPMGTQIFNRNSSVVEPDFTDYAQALEESARSGKPVLIDFTGYGCVNCRKMEASVWTDPRVSATINNEYILVSLFVDDKTPLKEPVSIVENGNNTKIRTVGDKWSLLQRHKFGANAQPFYVIVNPDGELMAGPYTFNTDTESFLRFLNRN